MTTSPQSIEAAGPEASPESRPNTARELSCGEEAAGSNETDNCRNGEETGSVDETDTCPDLPEEEMNIEEPLPVDDNLENMVLSNKKGVAKLLKQKNNNSKEIIIEDFCPLKYIKRNITEYCIRVRVNSCKILDLHCQYKFGAHKFLSVKWMKHEDDKMTFEFKS